MAPIFLLLPPPPVLETLVEVEDTLGEDVPIVESGVGDARELL
jgi:hypothetical protein